MNFRTDLALERREILKDREIEGVTSVVRTVEDVTVTEITVENERGEKAISKPKGKYITVEVKSFTKAHELFDSQLLVLSDELKNLLPKEGTILVAGLGNDKITPDALGPKCVSLLLATRHLTSEFAKSIGFDSLRSVAGLIPGVLGQTGIETSEILAGVVRQIKPAAVITVDALASRRLERLGNTVQMSDTGVSPGSGVGNKRSEISKKTLGVPVIAIGVPTVVDGATMAFDLLEKSGFDFKHSDMLYRLHEEGNMMVTPKEIDLVIERAAQLVAMAINTALQPDIPPEDILAVVS